MSYPSAKVVALGLAGLLAMGLMGRGLAGSGAVPDTLLGAGFGAMLADADSSWSTTPPNVWLSGLGPPVASPGKPLRVGDVITIAAPGASSGSVGQTIEVTSLEHIDGGVIGLGHVRLQLVTGRTGRVGGGGIVRFLFSVDATREPVTPMGKAVSDRAL